MKKLFLVLVLFTTGCSTTHDYMKNAYVGYVDSKAIVLRDAGTRNGIHFYKPQFDTDCPYTGIFQTDNNSTTCYIRESRISDLVSYRDHKARPSKKQHSQPYQGEIE